MDDFPHLHDMPCKGHVWGLLMFILQDENGVKPEKDIET